jgi:hypothetical protein
MFDAVKLMIIQSLMTSILARMDGNTMRLFFDAGLDKIEELVASSENDLDDKIVQPLIDQIRKEFDIPDNDV